MKNLLIVMVVAILVSVCGFVSSGQDYVFTDGKNIFWYTSGTNTPAVTLFSINSVTSPTNYVTRTNDNWVIMVASNPAVTLTNTLPTAIGVAGQSHHIASATNSVSDVVVDPNGSELINKDLTFTLKREEAISIVSDGANWTVY